MERIFNFLIDHKGAVIVLFLTAAVISIALIPLTVINYDLTEYLPEDSGTKGAIIAARAEFGYSGTARIMAEDVTLAEAADLKQRIMAINGVKDVIWLDNLIDITKPEEFIAQDTMKDFYKDGSALFQVEFEEDNFAESTSGALDEMEKMNGGLIAIGDAQNSRNLKMMVGNEVFKIVAFILPIIILVLVAASSAWLEPLIYLIVIGVSVAINSGTNSMLKSISFITNSMAALLQLAISMDYSIFLMHRYFEERDRGLESRQAIIRASVKTLSSISASALTTIAGFLSLMFMSYGIGSDIGLVLAKGIVISLLTVVILLPALIAAFSKTIDKTRHRPFLPDFYGIGRIAAKCRHAILVIALILIIPSFMAQTKNEFTYGGDADLIGIGSTFNDGQKIIDKFGIDNPVMILVPKGDIKKEAFLAQRLERLDYVRSVVSLGTLADYAIPPSFIPAGVRENFESENYSRIIVNLNFVGEIPQSFDGVEEIRSIVGGYYPDGWKAAGTSTGLADIKDTITRDSRMVSVITLVAIGLIVLITFKSFSIPIILLAVIQSAVWMNMAFPYFTGFKMDYVGYLIVGALQLGATVDYGILFAGRYLSFRRKAIPKEAAILAAKTAGSSIATSALILATAGFGFGLISQVDSVSGMGILIGRGALLSAIMALFLLPALLIGADRIIYKTTYMVTDWKR
ncbi:MAG: MMPL family transporter [Clostridiales bacterium]|nr:MMPL family transporter [Clostridiales bacterium]